MSEPGERPRRSGCAIVMGLTLIGLGSVFLVSNLFGLSLVRFWSRALLWFSTYWPLLLIVWGAYKLYQRVAHPERARVGAGEIFLMLVLVMLGLAFAFTRHAVERISGDISWDEIIEGMGPEITGPAHRFSEEQVFEIPADLPLRIENPRGSVSIEGWDQPTMAVTLVKRVHHFSAERAEEIAGNVTLDFESGDGGALLKTSRPSSGEATTEVQTDLELKLPKTVRVTVTNRRGPIRLTGIEADVSLSSADDAIEVRNVGGNVTLETQRGPLRLEQIRGDVEARNRHGSINAKAISGRLVAETTDGAIVLEQIGGNVRLKNRHARIRALDLGGDVEVEASHTEISVEEAAGMVTLETSYRPVFIREVEGRVRVEARNSEIEVRDVNNDVDLTSRYRPITVTSVTGGLKVNGSQCRVSVDRVQGPIEIESSYNRVEVNDFRSSLKVEARHAPLVVTTDRLEADLSLRTTYGDVELRLPGDASFHFSARTKDGELGSDFEQGEWVKTSDDEGELWRGAFGGGTFPLVIETSYGDISIAKREAVP